MNTRLKVICILLGAVYLIVLGVGTVMSFKEEVASLKEVFNEKHGKKVEWLDLHLTPKNYKTNYTESLFNKKTGETEKGKIKFMEMKVENPKKIPAYITIMSVFCMMISIFYLFALIWIPVLLFKFIYSFLKKGIFENDNTQRLIWMGWGLIFVFSFEFLFQITYYLQAKALVELNDYDISFSFDYSYLYLIFGLVMLLFGEVLKISVKMKEEVDLTV